METRIDLFQLLQAAYRIEDIDLRTYSPLGLAYIGDAVFDLVMRTKALTQGNTQVNKLHKKVSSQVNAHAQAVMITLLMDELTEEELQVYKRGRNAQSHSKAKNATVKEYRMATGFEAVLGYLYLNHESDRLFRLIQMGRERMEEQ